MSDFNTIPARPLSEKPDEEPEKKEETKPSVEPEDWGTEAPVPEPDFFSSNDDATRISEHPLQIEPKPAEEIKPFESVEIEEAQSVKTVAFEQIKAEPANFDAPKVFEMPPVNETKLAEPVFHVPADPKPVQPEVFDIPPYKPSTGGILPEGQPPKKNKTWLIVLIVVVVLCVCCVALIAALLIAGLLPFSTEIFSSSMLPYLMPI